MTARTARLALQRGAGRPLAGLAAAYLTEYFDKIDLAVAPLDEEEIWARSGVGTNSIANLILHLCGNLSLWVLSTLGRKEFVRDRAAEFTADRTASKSELLGDLRRVIEEGGEIIGALDEERLSVRLDVQGYSTDVAGVVFHAVEHMSYHSGQIVLLAKQMLSGRDGLEFYPHHRGE